MELVDLYDENRAPLGRTAERYGPKALENTGRWCTYAPFPGMAGF